MFTERHDKYCKQESVFRICIHWRGRKFDKNIYVSELPETMDIINFIHADMKSVFKHRKNVDLNENSNRAVVR